MMKPRIEISSEHDTVIYFHHSVKRDINGNIAQSNNILTTLSLLNATLVVSRYI